jgi:ankyrin repeat protein
MKKVTIIIICLFIALVQPLASMAEIYKYVDEKGQTHFTDNIGQVPEKYRNQIKIKTHSVKNSTVQASQLEKDVFRALNYQDININVEELFSDNINLKARNRRGKTFLHIASQRGHLNVIEYLLSKGVDVNVKDDNGRTPLIMAVFEGKLEATQLLLSHGADTNGAMIVASSFGHTDIVDLLSNQGVEKPAEYQDPRFSTPEKTWQLHKEALMNGDISLALECMTPERALEQKELYDALGKEKLREIAEEMRPIQKITQDQQSAKYRIRRKEEYGGEMVDITYYVYFAKVLGNWKIVLY